MPRFENALAFALAGILCLTGTSIAQGTSDPLKAGFENPPASARPRVWWHWLNGNITQEGIKLDLEWMHRVGIAGFQNFDAALQTPQVVDKRLAYMTPEWKDAFRYAVHLGDQFGMEMAIAGSPGWSESGGPWVPPSHGMKKYVWSETVVAGGAPFSGQLAHPPTNTGAFQNIGVRDQTGGGENPRPVPEFYADAAVIAFPISSGADDNKAGKPTITSSGPGLDTAILGDGELTKTTHVPIPGPGAESWIQFEYSAPHTVRAVSYVMPDIGFREMLAGITAPEKALEASDDGREFRVVANLNDSNSPEHTISFEPITARYFRVTFKRGVPPPRPAWAEGIDSGSLGGGMGTRLPDSYEIAELVLITEARVNHFEQKAAFVPAGDLYADPTPSGSAADTIPKANVIDLTTKMRPDGSLDWTPPPGKWIVLRIGYSLLGITNHPATPEATGLEVDKLDRRFVRDYFEKYLDSYKDTVGADEMGKKGIRYVINDSWEAGSQNWTDNMIGQFKNLRGYDPTPWLPVLTGRVVESAADSDRFLWDFRKTIADLITTEHYGELEKVLHERAMGHYGESHEAGRAFVADGMEVKKFNEVPMSAMWTQRPGVNRPTHGYNADDREAASVSHIYGQNLAAAESMTAAAAPWGWSPATLKPTADQELLNGINRFVIHESAHQPLINKAPGLSLGPFGQWFNRNETWAEQAGPWMDYLARSSYMLQQGHFAADVIYFYGEDNNLTELFRDKAPNIPPGYGFDYVNADALIHELQAANGAITTKSGMRYRILALDPNSEHMSLPVLRAIYRLVKDGAIVVGPKPVDDASLADDRAEFAKLSAALFGDGKGPRKVGNGSVYAGTPLKEALAALHVTPDFDPVQKDVDADIEFAHRKLAAGDIYFLDNRSDHDTNFTATFRVTGRTPELWRAEHGTISPVSFTVANGRTSVQMHLEAWGTAFVVFRGASSQTSRELPAVMKTQLATLDGPWAVAFQPGRGAPGSIQMKELTDWSQSDDSGVKYFSGLATYTNQFDVRADWLRKGGKLWIDLGEVKNLAVVMVNGKKLGEAWHAPYRVDATAALKPGSNAITVEVANAWVNRLIGDQQPGATQYTFTTVKPYRANSPLQPSGLLGPVTLLREEGQQAN
jgi:alpha-L-rhamnosidase